MIPAMTSGGVESRRKLLLKYTDKKLFAHHFCTIRINDNYREEMGRLGGVLHVAPKGTTWAPRDLRGHGFVRNVIRSVRPDIVHGAVFEANSAACFGTMLARVGSLFSSGSRVSPRLVVEETSYPFNRSLQVRVFQRAVFEMADRCVAVSPPVEEWLKRRLGIDDRRVVMIANGVELLDEDRATIRRGLVERFSIRPGDFVVGAVGRCHDYYRRFSVLIKGFRRVLDRIPEAKLLIVGGGRDFEGYERLVRDQGLESVVVLTGYQPDAYRFCHLMDVFAMPTRMDSFGLVFVEAMAAGVPVIAPAVGGVPYVVSDGETGLLTPPGDDAAFFEKVVHLYERPDLRSRMGTAGKRRAFRYFSHERYVGDVMRLYNSLVPDTEKVS